MDVHKVLDAHPARGASWETFVLEEKQLLKCFLERVAHADLQTARIRTSGNKASASLDRTTRRRINELSERGNAVFVLQHVHRWRQLNRDCRAAWSTRRPS